MDNEGGIVHRKYGSKPLGKQCPPIGTKPETHNDRRVPNGSENISYGRRGTKAFGRHPYDPMEYNDIFGGPPRHISTTHADKRSVVIPKVYDEVFKGFRTESHLSSKGSAALPVFELPAYEKSSLPVFELPVIGGSSLPVFDVSSRGEDLGSGGTWTKSSSDDFYNDIFGGSGGVSSSNKNSVSKSSRSRSKSSSSHLSSENLSPHHLLFPRMTEDQSSSSFVSKLRPIAIFPKQDRSSIFGIPCRQQREYPSPGSDEVSVVSSACSSPSLMNSSDPFSLHSSGCNKPLAFNKGKAGLKLDDVFEVFPQQGHLIHFQSTVKPEEESINRFKAGTTLGIVDQADIPEHYYSALLNAPRNNPANYGYDLGEQINASAVSHQTYNGNASLAEKSVKGLEKMLLPIDRAHLMIPNMIASTPLQSPPALHRVKSCEDWASEVKRLHLNQKRGSSSISSAGSSCISPTTDSGSGAQEQQEEFKLEDLGRNSLDDGEGSDFLGSYVIEIVSHRSKNFIFPDENLCHGEDSSMPDASAVAMKEAIAWAKEKFQCGSWKEGREEVPTFVQGPKHKDSEVWVHETTQTDAGTERIIQVGNDAGTNGEGRLQEMSTKSLSHGAFQRSENLAEGLTDQSEYRSESHDELLKCNKVSDQPNREIELRMSPLPVQCAIIDAQERVIKEVLDDVMISCKQHPMNHDDMGTFSRTPELQNTYAMDTTSDIPTMVGLSNLWDESGCYELQGHDFDGHVVCNNSHQFKGNDVQSTMVKEIPKMRTKLKLEQQQRENEHMTTLEILNRGIRCWSAGKEGNIRSLLATLQHVLWPESGWQQIPLIDMIEEEVVKKTYQKATLCIHPDKVQQKGATMQQKYVAEKVFGILQRAWIAFNSEDKF